MAMKRRRSKKPTKPPCRNCRTICRLIDRRIAQLDERIAKVEKLSNESLAASLVLHSALTHIEKTTEEVLA
jgi:hypothetical protein